MSVGLYDKAIIDKLSSWTKNTSVSLVGPNDAKRLFEMTADKSNDDAIKLPLIVLSRRGGYSVLDKTKRVLSFDGAGIDVGSSRKCQLNAIPISIPYQLDVYTRYFEEADEFSRNLVFNIINYPKLDVIVPYNNENYIHHSNIRLNGEIEDTSDIPERLIPGQFVRMSMQIIVDDAYLFDVRYRDVYSFEYSMKINED